MPFSFGDKPRTHGQTASVTCNVDGDKPVTIKWSLNDEDIGNVNNIMVVPLGDSASLLNIQQVTATHMGSYTCIAKNPAGITRHSANLTVTGIFYRPFFTSTFIFMFSLFIFVTFLVVFLFFHNEFMFLVNIVTCGKVFGYFIH